jgi:hypothetical protein
MVKQKQNIKFLHYTFDAFTFINFKNDIISNFKLNTTYAILLKISSQNFLTYKMCGRQFPIIMKDNHDVDYYENIYNLILTKIEATTDIYNYIDKVDGIQIIYSVFIAPAELTLKNISKYPLNKNIINIKETNKNFNENLLPLTTDTSYYGITVIEEEKQKYIDLINNNNPNFNNSNKNEIFNKSDDFFIYTSSKNEEKKNNKHKFIIISKELNKLNFIRYIFDFSTGIFIKIIQDEIIIQNAESLDKLEVDSKVEKENNKEKEILFNRTIGNTTLKIDKKRVISYKAEYKLNPIQPHSNELKDRNSNFGSFDLETFKDNDGLAKVYALGFMTNIDPEPKLYYLSDSPDLDSNKLILKCINEMLISKYHNYIFYTHNFAKYDVVFLYNMLLNYNLERGEDYYILETIMRDNRIIKLNIKIKVKSENNENKVKYIKIALVDSINLLDFSLEKLTKEFSLEVQKGKFPHSFMNRNNLNYRGDKPDIHYFDKIDQQDYDNIPKTNWNVKEECLKYLTKDVKGLYYVMEEFSRLIYIYFNVQLTEALTITRLAINIFKKKYYKIKKIPYIIKYFLFSFIKEGYYGGITEVYIPYGKDLIYIDINSLYPYVGLKPMPGNQCIFLESFDEKGLELEELFGFFYCKVKTNDLYIGLLPVRINNQLVYPNGEFHGIWSSEELKFAKSKGYEIKVIKGYNFNKVENIFKDYIIDLYEKKKNSTGFLKLIYKSLLNNFLGRFGLSIIKPITQTVNRERRDFIMATRNIHSHTILNDNKFLITYDPIISKEICQEHGLDILKVLDNESKLNIEKNLDLFKDVSIATSAKITAYSRIEMNEKKLEILEKGGKIYYSDTDSIVLDKIYINKEWIGDEIGKFKLEYEIKEAYFISNKTYCLILNNGESVIKTKGIINNSITIEDFKEMYWNQKNIKATKVNTVTNYTKSSVLIEKKDVMLNYDAYTKREKIFNNEGIWIDTKPLIFNDAKEAAEQPQPEKDNNNNI